MISTDTIAAIATPSGYGGIGIVRISGTAALSIAEKLFRRKMNEQAFSNKAAKNLFKSHRMVLGHVIDPQKNQIIDETMLVVMRAPRSYTREDVVEFQCHGGALVLGKVLQSVIEQGARIAEPGEFTRRAFLNGRMDLSQAEAVVDLINATNDLALKAAIKQLDGQLKTQIEQFIELLTGYYAIIEAGIEFPEEIDEQPDYGGLKENLDDRLLTPLRKIITDSETSRPLFDGFYLDIIGRPNVGKSSLLNRLLNKERAIVSPIPGTTRDFIEDTTRLQGILVHITDTAGIHLSDDPLEKIGIQKAKSHLKDSDLILFVVEADQINHPEDRNVFESLNSRNVILVINKIDLISNRVELKLPSMLEGLECVQISALHGDGLEKLIQYIVKRFQERNSYQDKNLILANLRQTENLRKACTAVERSIKSLENNLGVELISCDIDEALRYFRKITGEVYDTDILDEVFRQFCIGK